jgi:hypothetical protein
MATGVLKCDLVALGNVAAVFVVKSLSARSVKALQSGGEHPTSICSKLTERLSI